MIAYGKPETVFEKFLSFDKIYVTLRHVRLMFDTFCSLSELHKHCCVVKTIYGTEKGKQNSLRVADNVHPTSPGQRGRCELLPRCL